MSLSKVGKRGVDEYRRRLLAEVDQGYAALRQEPKAWAAEQAERAALAGTLLDGLDPDELWTEDGDLVRGEPAARHDS